MVRAQIVLDEPTADRLRVVSERSHASMSEVVRQALVFYFEHRKPDTAWIGSLKPKRKVSHDLDDIRGSVAAGRRREGKP
jgi:Arc/MetJ-type ribon-helix-helix transcriptional regulator